VSSEMLTEPHAQQKGDEMKITIQVRAGASDVYGSWADHKTVGSADIDIELASMKGATFAGIIDALTATAIEKHLAKVEENKLEEKDAEQ
jgi:hypothetical protein